MNEKELIEEVQNIKKLIVLQLIASGVKKGGIEEMLKLGDRNFARYFDATKLISRMQDKEGGNKRERKMRK